MFKSLFPTGEVVATPAAFKEIEDSGQQVMYFLLRHVTGDWGDLCEEDKAINEAAVKNGNRILSAYELINGSVIWIITEAADDSGRRVATSVILKEEY